MSSVTLWQWMRDYLTFFLCSFFSSKLLKKVKQIMLILCFDFNTCDSFSVFTETSFWQQCLLCFGRENKIYCGTEKHLMTKDSKIQVSIIAEAFGMNEMFSLTYCMLHERNPKYIGKFSANFFYFALLQVEQSFLVRMLNQLSLRIQSGNLDLVEILFLR